MYYLFFISSYSVGYCKWANEGEMVSGCFRSSCVSNSQLRIEVLLRITAKQGLTCKAFVHLLQKVIFHLRSTGRTAEQCCVVRRAQSEHVKSLNTSVVGLCELSNTLGRESA